MYKLEEQDYDNLRAYLGVDSTDSNDMRMDKFYGYENTNSWDRADLRNELRLANLQAYQKTTDKTFAAFWDFWLNTPTITENNLVLSSLSLSKDLFLAIPNAYTHYIGSTFLAESMWANVFAGQPWSGDQGGFTQGMMLSLGLPFTVISIAILTAFNVVIQSLRLAIWLIEKSLQLSFMIAAPFVILATMLVIVPAFYILGNFMRGFGFIPDAYASLEFDYPMLASMREWFSATVVGQGLFALFNPDHAVQEYYATKQDLEKAIDGNNLDLAARILFDNPYFKNKMKGGDLSTSLDEKYQRKFIALAAKEKSPSTILKFMKTFGDDKFTEASKDTSASATLLTRLHKSGMELSTSDGHIALKARAKIALITSGM